MNWSKAEINEIKSVKQIFSFIPPCGIPFSARAGLKNKLYTNEIWIIIAVVIDLTA